MFTTKSLQGYPIEDFGYQLGRAWGIGQKGTNNGVVLIVAPTEHKVRIEVGRGLEPQLTDPFQRLSSRRQCCPPSGAATFPAGSRLAFTYSRCTFRRCRGCQRTGVAPPRSARRGQSSGELIPLLFVIGIFLFVIWVQSRAQQPLVGGALSQERLWRPNLLSRWLERWWRERRRGRRGRFFRRRRRFWWRRRLRQLVERSCAVITDAERMEVEKAIAEAEKHILRRDISRYSPRKRRLLLRPLSLGRSHRAPGTMAIYLLDLDASSGYLPYPAWHFCCPCFDPPLSSSAFRSRA